MAKNMDGTPDSIKVDLDSLMSLCVHVCTKDESNCLMDMLNKSMPRPYIPVFKIYKNIYSKNYDRYLNDCKIHGVKPFPQDIINRISEDFYVDVNTGCISGISDDCYFVNIYGIKIINENFSNS